jgi:hypothetical protein
MTFLAGALFGASIALVLVMILRRPPGITKHARKPVDVPYHERRYRGKETTVVTPAWERQETVPVEPIYMYGVTGCEKD